MKIAIVLGTRPEIIKMSSLIRECEVRKLDYFVLHTGQHYTRELDEIMFEDLELPKPKYNLEVGSKSKGEQIGEMICKIEKIFLSEKPDVVFVQGDTNSVLAGALAASKNRIAVGHVEAGLRSFDNSMTEEHNRIVTDHLSDFLFAPTEKSAEILKDESVDSKKIFVVGNTIVDAVFQNLEIAEKKSMILKNLNLEPRKYLLATSHRAENVDDSKKLKDILEGLALVALETDLTVVFPMHPRTAKKIEEFKIQINSRIKPIEPVGFLEFLYLEKNARLILTDSGGVQEEACIRNVPCVTLRENTERPETVEIGKNIVAGTTPEKILESAKKLLVKDFKENSLKEPFGDGKTAEKIISICLKYLR